MERFFLHVQVISGHPANSKIPLNAFPLCFGSGTVQHCQTAGGAGPRSSRNNYIITHNSVYRYVLLTQQWQVFPTDGLEEGLYLSLSWEFCSAVKKEDFIWKINRMWCCCFGVWLPVCFVQNSAQLLRRALVLHIWDGADRQHSGTSGSKHVDYHCCGRSLPGHVSYGI